MHRACLDKGVRGLDVARWLRAQEKAAPSRRPRQRPRRRMPVIRCRGPRDCRGLGLGPRGVAQSSSDGLVCDAGIPLLVFCETRLGNPHGLPRKPLNSAFWVEVKPDLVLLARYRLCGPPFPMVLSRAVFGTHRSPGTLISQLHSIDSLQSRQHPRFVTVSSGSCHFTASLSFVPEVLGSNLFSC